MLDAGYWMLDACLERYRVEGRRFTAQGVRRTAQGKGIVS